MKDYFEQYFDTLLSQDSYRGWHVIQADRVSHEAITKALQAIMQFSRDGKMVATDQTLSRLNVAIGRGPSSLPVRKQILVNLDTLKFITREGAGQKQIIELTSAAHEYLNYEEKEFYMDTFLENFKIHVPDEIKPFPILLKILSDSRINILSLREFQFFISQITQESQMEGAINDVLSYRRLSNQVREEIVNYVKIKCENITQRATEAGLHKSAKRDFENWTHNSKHSIEFFSLGSQVKLVQESIHLLLGSPELKRKIINNLKLIDNKARIQKQVVHFRDRKVMDDLKKLYSYYCQFCGYNFTRIPTKEGFYVEAAHIVPVRKQSQRTENLNDPSNIVIACPNHHKTIDMHFPEFVKEFREFDDGKVGLETIDGSTKLYLTLNEHIDLTEQSLP